MIMKRIPWALCALLIVASAPALLFAQAQAKKNPPFRIKAEKATLDVDAIPPLVYDGNVRFTSTLHNTSITCRHLEVDAVSFDKVKHVEASGNVVFSLTSESKEKGKPSYRLDGNSEVVRYSLATTDPMIRLLTDKGVRPHLTITNLDTKEKTDIDGKEIEYNLVMRKLTASEVDMGNEGDGQ